ncbi:MAG: lytic transglycosylase domain-containing protein [Candidatus Acidiferrales bacterium]
MPRWTQQLGMSVVLVALAASAWSQTAHYTVPAVSVGDDFAAYGQALDSAADSALANVMREAAASSQIAEVAGKTTAPPDAKALHQFAEQYWNGNDEAVRRAIARVTELRPVLTPIFHKEGIPTEIAALVLVESAGLPAALSPKGARGIWQFMPDTARRYGLVVTADLDERTEVVKSTVAAARYLHDLYQRFGDWQLAFAAYNAGEQTVERAVARTGYSDFSRIDRALPEETRNYVPAVLRAIELLGSNKGEVLPLVRSGKSPIRSVLYALTERAE